MATVYVDPLRGNNQNSGQSNTPLRTLTYALQQIEAGSQIQLQPGDYSVNSGESFPLKIPADVVVTGNATNHGRNVKIYGGGSFRSSEFGAQSATVVLEHVCDLQGVTVTNPIEKGTGIWIEGASPTIAYCTLVHCRREGIFILGQGAPLIHHCMIQTNAASGVFFARQAKGELRHNQFQNTGYGIAVSDQAAPFIIDNQLLDNRSGLVISRTARPVLRDNLIARSQGDGLAVINSAQPDLGDREEPGHNVFEDSRGFDINNQTSIPLRTSGNQINPNKVSGSVQQIASILPPFVERNSGGSSSEPPALPPNPPTSEPPTTPAAFPDISNHWARLFIDALANRGMVQGFPDGNFRPEVNLTRAEYAALLTQTFSRPQQRLVEGFPDVPSSFWAAPAIVKAAQMGFIAGFPDGTFRPQEPLTRLQILLSLVNGLSIRGGSSTGLGVYQDRAEIPSYAVGAVAIATQNQLVVNYPNPNLLEPSVPASRAETVAILYQALVVIGEARLIPSPYIVVPRATSAAFADIQGQWAAPYIQGIASQGYVGGFSDGTFHPNDPVSRTQYAVWLDQTLGLPPLEALQTQSTAQAPNHFQDMPSTHWAFPALQRLIAAGILSSDAEGNVNPDEPILRSEVVTALATGLALANLHSATAPSASSQSLAAAPTPQQAIANLNAMGLPLPARITQRPWDHPATRGEVAACIYPLLVYQRRAQAIAPNPELESPASSSTSTTQKIAATTQPSTPSNPGRSLSSPRQLRPVVVALATAIQHDEERDQAETSEAETSDTSLIGHRLEHIAGAIANKVSADLKRQGIEVRQVGLSAHQATQADPVAELLNSPDCHVGLLIVLQSCADKSETSWRMVPITSPQNGKDSALSNSTLSINVPAADLAATLTHELHWQLLEGTNLKPEYLEPSAQGLTPNSEREPHDAPYPITKVQLSLNSETLLHPQSTPLLQDAQSWAKAIAQGLLTYIQRYVSP
ncbi:MAG: S-layer homology domain-containing protein [Elainellaceae cyanobacterium]